MNAQDCVEEMATSGRYHFTTDDLLAVMNGSPSAVRAQLRRLKEKGRIASPMRSFHVIVPPEYRRLGCLPAEQFIDQLMEVLGEPYYVALLSAAERYGAAHQRPQALQVMLPRSRSELTCGAVRVTFIGRSDMKEMPVRVFNTPRGRIRYSTPEVTALELVGYPHQAGGISNVATVLSELAEEIDPEELLVVAQKCPISWAQRLGYLWQVTGHHEPAEKLQPYVEAQARSYAPLRRSEDVAGATRIPEWKLIVNVAVEPRHQQSHSGDPEFDREVRQKGGSGGHSATDSNRYRLGLR